MSDSEDEQDYDGAGSQGGSEEMNIFPGSLHFTSNSSRMTKAKVTFAGILPVYEDKPNPTVKKSRLRAKDLREIQEYHQLMRTIRAEETMDLSNLLVNALTNPKSHDDLGMGKPQMEENPRPKEKPAKRSYAQLKRTAWPIPSPALPVPEFSFTEEIRHIAEKLAISTSPQSAQIESEGLEGLDVLPDTVVDALSTRSFALLEHALDLMHRYRPATAKATQSLLKPLEWEDLLGALVASEAVDVEVIERSRKRLEDIFGKGTRTYATERGDVMVERSNQSIAKASVFDYDHYLDDEVELLGVAKEVIEERRRVKPNIVRPNRKGLAKEPKPSNESKDPEIDEDEWEDYDEDEKDDLAIAMTLSDEEDDEEVSQHSPTV